MNLIDRLEDLVGCTVIHVDKTRGHVVVWNGSKTLLRYHVRGDRLTEAGSHTASVAPVNAEAARALALRVCYF